MVATVLTTWQGAQGQSNDKKLIHGGTLCLQAQATSLIVRQRLVMDNSVFAACYTAVNIWMLER